MAFDFAIGTYGKSRFSRINSALADSGVSGIRGDGEIEGLMNGSIDLVFVHDKRIYIVDYKSNTLGRTPEFYDDAGMTGCMTAKRYDLQYMIYSVAAHRYFSQRLGARYSYDGGEYSFGGVFYLFLRGMGLAGALHLGSHLFELGNNAAKLRPHALVQPHHLVIDAAVSFRGAVTDSGHGYTTRHDFLVKIL